VKMSIIIPVFNEEDGIEGTLSEIESYMNGYLGTDGWEVIVVDDGSEKTARNKSTWLLISGSVICFIASRTSCSMGFLSKRLTSRICNRVCRLQDR